MGTFYMTGNDTHLVYHEDRHHGALFEFDEEDYVIKHIGGKIWHPLWRISKSKE